MDNVTKMDTWDAPDILFYRMAHTEHFKTKFYIMLIKCLLQSPAQHDVMQIDKCDIRCVTCAVKERELRVDEANTSLSRKYVQRYVHIICKEAQTSKAITF